MAKQAPARRFFIGGKIGRGIGLPYGSPFSSLGAELDVTNNLALLVGDMKLAGWIGAMGARSYVGHPNAVCPPLIGICVAGRVGVYAGVDYDFSPRQGLAATYRIQGFGDTNPSDGIVDGLSLLLGLGYKV